MNNSIILSGERLKFATDFVCKCMNDPNVILDINDDENGVTFDFVANGYPVLHLWTEWDNEELTKIMWEIDCVYMHGSVNELDDSEMQKISRNLWDIYDMNKHAMRDADEAGADPYWADVNE